MLLQFYTATATRHQWLPPPRQTFQHSFQGSISASGSFSEVQRTAAYEEMAERPSLLRSVKPTLAQRRLEMVNYSMEGGLEETATEQQFQV